jgi:hypothetical protein
MEELTDLIWTVINSLGSTSPFHVQAAAQLLLSAIQEHGAKLLTVRGWGPHPGLGWDRQSRGLGSSQNLGPPLAKTLFMALMGQMGSPLDGDQVNE